MKSQSDEQLIYLNTGFIAAGEARVSVFDRGFLYGDTLFETLRVANGRVFRWEPHWERLAAGAGALRLALPVTEPGALKLARELLRRNQIVEGVLRVTVSRGVGAPGYSPRGAGPPTFAMWAHPLPPLREEAPARWRLRVVSTRVGAEDALGQFKTGNKLRQVLARAEAEEAGADEALLLNGQGSVVEGAASNFFWVRGGGLRTPPLSSGALPGTTRQVVLEICRAGGIAVVEEEVVPESLRAAEGMFCTLSSLGIVEIAQFGDEPVRESSLVRQLHALYVKKLCQETAAQSGILLQ